MLELKSIKYKNQYSKVLASSAKRSDVENLSNWLDLMLTKLLNEKSLSINALFENLQLIYSGCFQELIRQISFECNERGILIQKIWNAYLKLFEKAIGEQTHIISKQELNNLKEETRLHKLYQKELENLNKNLKNEINEKNKTKESLNKYIENYKYLKNKNEKVEKLCKICKNNFESIKTEYSLLHDDYILAKNLLEKYLTDQKNDEFEMLMRRLPKRENKINSTKFFIPIKKKITRESFNEEDENNEKIDNELFINDKAIDTKDLESNFQSDENFQTEEIIKNEKEIQSDEIGETQIEKNYKSIVENFQIENQDLKIKIAEKENEIDNLNDKINKNEQELRLISHEV